MGNEQQTFGSSSIDDSSRFIGSRLSAPQKNQTTWDPDADFEEVSKYTKEEDVLNNNVGVQIYDLVNSVNPNNRQKKLQELLVLLKSKLSRQEAMYLAGWLRIKNGKSSVSAIILKRFGYDSIKTKIIPVLTGVYDEKIKRITSTPRYKKLYTEASSVLTDQLKLFYLKEKKTGQAIDELPVATLADYDPEPNGDLEKHVVIFFQHSKSFLLKKDLKGLLKTLEKFRALLNKQTSYLTLFQILRYARKQLESYKITYVIASEVYCSYVFRELYYEVFLRMILLAQKNKLLNYFSLRLPQVDRDFFALGFKKTIDSKFRDDYIQRLDMACRNGEKVLDVTKQRLSVYHFLMTKKSYNIRIVNATDTNIIINSFYNKLEANPELVKSQELINAPGPNAKGIKTGRILDDFAIISIVQAHELDYPLTYETQLSQTGTQKIYAVHTKIYGLLFELDFYQIENMVETMIFNSVAEATAGMKLFVSFVMSTCLYMPILVEYGMAKLAMDVILFELAVPKAEKALASIDPGLKQIAWLLGLMIAIRYGKPKKVVINENGMPLSDAEHLANLETVAAHNEAEFLSLPQTTSADVVPITKPGLFTRYTHKLLGPIFAGIAETGIMAPIGSTSSAVTARPTIALVEEAAVATEARLAAKTAEAARSLSEEARGVMAETKPANIIDSINSSNQAQGIFASFKEPLSLFHGTSIVVMHNIEAGGGFVFDKTNSANSDFGAGIYFTLDEDIATAAAQRKTQGQVAIMSFQLNGSDLGKIVDIREGGKHYNIWINHLHSSAGLPKPFDGLTNADILKMSVEKRADVFDQFLKKNKLEEVDTIIGPIGDQFTTGTVVKVDNTGNAIVSNQVVIRNPIVLKKLNDQILAARTRGTLEEQKLLNPNTSPTHGTSANTANTNRWYQNQLNELRARISHRDNSIQNMLSRIGFTIHWVSPRGLTVYLTSHGQLIGTYRALDAYKNFKKTDSGERWYFGWHVHHLVEDVHLTNLSIRDLYPPAWEDLPCVMLPELPHSERIGSILRSFDKELLPTSKETYQVYNEAYDFVGSYTGLGTDKQIQDELKSMAKFLLGLQD